MGITNKYIAWLILSFVIGALMLGLLSGFVPSIEKAEIRQRLSYEVAGPLTRPVTRPLSHVLWNVRGKIEHTQRVLPVESSASMGQNLLLFDQGQVQLRTAKGLALLATGDSNILAATPGYEGAFPFNAFFEDALSVWGDPMDSDGNPLRWNTGAKVCELRPEAQQRMLSLLEQWDKEQGAFAYSLHRRASLYKTAVESNARRFKLEPDLVYAIMYTESSFDPNLVSGQNAHGLMQVVPRTAGGEVNAWLGREGHPDEESLLDPTVNIKYGTAYLHLLMTRHLGGIKDPLSREYCTIAAYNIGSTGMLRVFGPSWGLAFATINSLTPHEVLAQLLEKLPSKETRVFVDRVLSTREHFVSFK